MNPRIADALRWFWRSIMTISKRTAFTAAAGSGSFRAALRSLSD